MESNSNLSFRIAALLSSSCLKDDPSEMASSNKDSWKLFMKSKMYHVWRRKADSGGKYEYKSKLFVLCIIDMFIYL